MLPRETCSARSTPAGGRADPTEVPRVGTSCLPDCKPLRRTQRYIPTVRADEDELTKVVVTLASEYGRYSYRRITALLRSGGWQVGKESGSAHLGAVRALKYQETASKGPSVAEQRPLRAAAAGTPKARVELRLRLGPAPRWSINPSAHADRRAHPRVPGYLVARRIKSFSVIETFANAIHRHGTPTHIRSHNGPEMMATIVRAWLAQITPKTLFIRGALGRTDTTRASTASSGTSGSTARSSTA